MHRLLHPDPPCASRVPSRVRSISDASTGSNAVSLAGMAVVCERGDSNPHGCPPDPKSGASANSATLASHAPKLMAIEGCHWEHDEPRRNRTFNLRIKSPLLCQLS